MHATAKDLRFNVKQLLETVDRGEEVIITYRGKACAKLVPIEANHPDKDHPDEDELFGIWKTDEQSADVEQYLRTLRRSRFDAD